MKASKCIFRGLNETKAAYLSRLKKRKGGPSSDGGDSNKESKSQRGKKSARVATEGSQEFITQNRALSTDFDSDLE